MHLLALLACSITPTRHRSFIQAEGVNNGLEGTATDLDTASPPVALVSASGEMGTPEPATYLLVKPFSIFGLLSMTAFISDLLSLDIPCSRLSPNCLMLAVVISPHGSMTALAGAATLSQAHLIQRWLGTGAEPQVRASFREFLQLHMQLRVAPQSSTSRMRTDCGGGQAATRRRRSSVGAETSIPSEGANRSLTSALVARPRETSASRRRLVMRTYDCTRSGSRSVKIRRE